MLLAWVSAVLSVFYVTRVGGDFMAGRFLVAPGEDRDVWVPRLATALREL